MTLQVDADHLALAGQDRHDRREHVDRAEAAVEKEERLALAADLVVVADTVRLDIAAPDGRRRRRLPGWHGTRVGGLERGRGRQDGGRGEAEQNWKRIGQHGVIRPCCGTDRSIPGFRCTKDVPPMPFPTTAREISRRR